MDNIKVTDIASLKKSTKWTEILLTVIEEQSISLDFGTLTQKEVDTMPWELLLKCTSVINLIIDSFPAPNISTKEPCQIFERLFPCQIFAMTNLQVLSMNYYPFAYISPKIGQLINLSRLRMLGSKIICLPTEIGKLKKLQCIEHYCSYSICFSPYEIMNCAVTKTYISRRTNYIYNNELLPPLPKPTPLKDVIADLKAAFVEYGLIAGFVDIILAYLPFQRCSNPKCDVEIYFGECIYYAWSYYKPGVDMVCLLARMCSEQCIQSIESGKRYYLGKMQMQTDKSEREMFVNVNVDEQGSIVAAEPFRWGQKTVLHDLKSQLYRFEYFWKYKLGIKYKSYELVEQELVDQKEIMVVFKLNNSMHKYW